MRSEDITCSATGLQHRLDTLSHEFEDGDRTGSFHASLDEFRRATVLHAAIVMELLRTAQLVVGNPKEVRELPALLEALFRITAQLRDEAPSPTTIMALTRVVDDLLASERDLMCHFGTFLFPAETW